MLNAASDESFSHSAAPSPDWFEFVPEISPTSKDIVITKKQWEHFVGPISNSSCGGVEWTRSCSVELQPILALRAQHGLPTILIPADFCWGRDGLQFWGTAQRNCEVYIQKFLDIRF